MIKIRFIKEIETCKIGDVKSASKKSAEDFVKNGYAEYVLEEEKKELKREFKPEEQVFANISAVNYKRLKDTFKGVDIDGIIEKKVKFYRIKPFKTRTKMVWIDEIKDYLELVNEDFEEEQEEININKSIQSETLELLKNSELFNNIISEFDKKIVGEEASKKAIFLSCCNIWVKGSEVPLNSLISAESSVGKSYECKNIIKIFPKELVEYRTKITPEAFTYWKNGEDWNWDGKICYLEDISQSILDSPTFRVMCSEGSTATIVIKQKAVDIEIQGKPVMLLTTARTNPSSEVLSRFQIISLDESKEQTKRIVYRQARQGHNQDYDRRYTEALRSLKRLNVVIPYSEKIANFLSESYNFDSLRLRRDFSRLLDLIKCSAVLYQFQRKHIDSETIEANEQDYEIAREVINYIETATFKGLTHKLKKAYDSCKELVEFTAKDIHSKYPFVNLKMWYNYLDDLAERGMLTTELKKIEESKSRVTFYKINEGKVFALPEFNNLPQNITNLTIVTNNTNDTNDTNDKNDCNNCNDYIKKAQINDINFSDSGIKEDLEDG